MLMHGTVYPEETTASWQAVGVTADGAMLVSDIGGALSELETGTSYVASQNYTQTGNQTINMVLTTGDCTWEVEIEAKASGLSRAYLYELYGTWTGGAQVIVHTLNRPTPYVDENAVDILVYQSTVGGMGQEVLAEDLEVGYGISFGGNRWRLNTDSEYAIEVEDRSGVASEINITLKLYLVEE